MLRVVGASGRRVSVKRATFTAGPTRCDSQYIDQRYSDPEYYSIEWDLPGEAQIVCAQGCTIEIEIEVGSKLHTIGIPHEID